MFFYTGRITDFRRPTHQSSLNRGLFAFLEHLKILKPIIKSLLIS
ncbi:hypothetical protein ACIN3137_A1509 [Acinetobacter baumannii OIFC137]|nr:hypothetical protein ACIN3137_A1509 [Acinetobacter baumannii OIFC137]EJO43589.1 hypothetical protein ACINIS123_2217 [Acinetobacter baumannii IS-123]EJP57387.1 hypothetical protein ACINNAV81_1516 [Acinetobacter baumannii Naval-81]